MEELAQLLQQVQGFHYDASGFAGATLRCAAAEAAAGAPAGAVAEQPGPAAAA